MPEQLAEEPECPEPLNYVWEMFLEMHARRRGEEALSNQEVLAWATLWRVALSTVEVGMLEALEGALSLHHAERARVQLEARKK